MSLGLIVAGAGTMGAWTALLALRAGRRVRLLDAYGAGNTLGSSGDATRVMRASRRRRVPRPLVAGGARAVDRVRRACRPAGLQPGRRAVVRSAQDGFEAASLRTSIALGIPVERLTPSEMSRRWPGIRGDDLTFALFRPKPVSSSLERGSRLSPGVSSSRARLETARARPGNVKGDRLVDVLTADGRRHGAAAFVFAAGPWLPALFPDVIGDRIQSPSRTSTTFARPTATSVGTHPPSRPGSTTTPRSMASAPTGMGQGRDRLVRWPWDPDTMERAVDPAAIGPVRAYCERRFPELAAAPVQAAHVCQYETTADSHFIIDRHPDL